MIPPKYDDLRPFSLSRLFFKQGNKWGIISVGGRVIKEPTFDDVDMALKSKLNEPSDFLHTYIFPYAFPTNGKAVVKQADKFFFVDLEGSTCFANQFDDAYPFSEGKAAVALKDESSKVLRYGFINEQGQVVIPCRFEFARAFKDGLAVVKTREGWGVINKRGQVVFPTKYDSISKFNDGLAAAKLNEKCFVLKRDGTALEVPGICELTPFSEGLATALVTKHTFYGVERESQKLVIRPELDGDEKIVEETDNPNVRIVRYRPTPNSVPAVEPPASADKANE